MNATSSNPPTLSYSVERSKRKSFGLKVDESANIIVKAPYFVSEKEIRSVVAAKETWLRQKVDLMTERNKERPSAVIINGSNILFLGEIHTIQVTTNKTRLIQLQDNKLLVSADLSQYMKKNIELWLKKQARTLFQTQIDEICSANQLAYKKLKLSSPKRRWGSCSSTGNININWRLIFAPQHIARYVIAHELAHTVHMNHSKKFWELVEDLHPNSQQDDKWLNQNGHKLDWN